MGALAASAQVATIPISADPTAIMWRDDRLTRLLPVKHRRSCSWPDTYLIFGISNGKAAPFAGPGSPAPVPCAQNKPNMQTSRIIICAQHPDLRLPGNGTKQRCHTDWTSCSRQRQTVPKAHSGIHSVVHRVYLFSDGSLVLNPVLLATRGTGTCPTQCWVVSMSFWGSTYKT